MARIKMIHHVNVQISDRQRTREWYEKVLGAEFLDRGPELNKRQLQLRIGTGEMHFSDTPDLTQVPRVHFAVEVDNWNEMLARLDELGVSHSRSSGANPGAPRTHEDNDFQGRREDNNEHFTYVKDPDGNLIELVYHPLGLEDSDGIEVEPADASKGLRWKQIPGFVTSS
jgi:lactoylglutathione lyase